MLSRFSCACHVLVVIEGGSACGSELPGAIELRAAALGPLDRIGGIGPNTKPFVFKFIQGYYVATGAVGSMCMWVY